MTAVILTHPVTYGGAELRAIQPGADPVELPAEVAAEVVRHGLGYLPPRTAPAPPPKAAPR